MLALAVCAWPLLAQVGAPRWVSAWAAAPCGVAEEEPHFDDTQLGDTTVREVVHLTASGLAVRVRLSNTFSTQPLVIDAIRVAPAMKDGEIDPAQSVELKSAGKSQMTVAPGKWLVTDAANLPVEAGKDLAVTFYVRGKVSQPSVHYMALQTGFEAKGDQTNAAKLADAKKTPLRLVVMGVEVASRTAPYTIAAIGSSTTDGAHSSPNQNRRWTDDLWRRLQEARGANAPAVVNLGVSGNRVLHAGRGGWGPVWGDAAVGRFNRDVIAQPGLKYVVAFEGGNDIRQPGSGAIPMEESVTAEQLEAGFKLMAQAAHDRGAKFIAGTITPFEHADKNRAEDPRWEKTRTAFNEWARHSREIDGVVDFDAAIRDPEHPARILAKYDSGDHLHPNDAGYQAMADSISLDLFQ